jgi:peptidoglycan/xylan/chitin deacetylase (PgdA/CDA1 family)
MKRTGHRPTLRENLHGIILNPSLIVLIIIAVGWMGWSHYLVVSHNFNLPTQDILPDGSFTTASRSGDPKTSWTMTENGKTNIGGSYTAGYITPRSLTVTVKNYQSGNATLTSPQASLQPNTKYLFKSFYKSSSSFELLEKLGYQNGSSKTELVSSYAKTTKWTAASTVLESGSNIKTVQFVFNFTSNGVAAFNETYLEKDPSVYLAPTPARHSDNLIQNATLQVSSSNYPDQWTAQQYGDNVSVPGFVETAAGRFLYVTTAVYKNGSTSWLPAAIPVQAGQYFNFNVNYKSNVSADIVATFLQSNGKYKFVTLETVMPNNTWATTTDNIEVPKDVTKMSVSVVLHHRGVISTNSYSLYNITDPGSYEWGTPTVSVAFEGGWQSQYNNALSLLQKYKDNGTFYVNPASIGTNNYMGTDELMNLTQDSNELASQGYDYTDLTTVNTNQANTEAKASQSYLKNTFHVPVTDFASPYGNTDPEVQTILHQYYKSNLSNLSGVNTKQNYDPYDLHVFYVGSNTPLSHIQNAIAEAQDYNGWLILVFGQIGTSHTGNMVAPKNLEAALQTLQKSGISVKTIGDAVKAANSARDTN